jgi:hypothetical protein
MGKAGHLNGLFFPITWKIVVKFAALVMAAYFFWLSVLVGSFGEILEKRKS